MVLVKINKSFNYSKLEILKIHLLLFVFYLLVPNKIFPQKFLELSKATKQKYYSFYPGETIRFKLYDDELFSSGTLTGIGDSTLNFNSIRIPISKIEIIDIRGKTSNRVRRIGSTVIGGSAAFFAIDFINLTLVQNANYKDVFSRNLLINCGIGVGVGLIIRSFGKRKYFKRNKLNRIWIQEI